MTASKDTIIKFKISDWEKDNPQVKIEGKYLYWFRLNTNFSEDPKLEDLSKEDKYTVILLLRLAAIKGSSVISMTLGSLSHRLETPIENLGKLFGEFRNRGIIEQITVESGKIDSQSRTEIQSNSDSVSDLDLKDRKKQKQTVTVTETVLADPNFACQEHNSEIESTLSTEQNSFAPSIEEAILINFEQLYSIYPRKEGRSRGLSVFRREVRSREEFDAFYQALQNYMLYTKRQKMESRFIKHFSTFMDEWKDWIDFKPPPETGYQVLNGGAYAE